MRGETCDELQTQVLFKETNVFVLPSSRRIIICVHPPYAFTTDLFHFSLKVSTHVRVMHIAFDVRVLAVPDLKGG